MKIALVYLDVPNLGDLVIHETARYLVEDIVRQRAETIELTDVSIDSYHWKQNRSTVRKKNPPILSTKWNKLYERILRKCYRMGALTGLMDDHLRKQWRATPAARYFYANERVKLEDANLILFCGGGFFKYHRQTFHFFLDDITALADERHIPVAFNAVGIEGYDGKDPECMLLKKAVNRDCVKFISCRDDYESLVRDYADNPSIIRRKSCDPAFWSKETYRLEWTGKESRLIGLNVIRPKIFREYLYRINKQQHFALYRDLIHLLVGKGYRVELFTNGMEQDGDFIRELLEAYPELKQRKDVSCFYPQTTQELATRISQYERLMAVRLHASIIGTVLGIPNVSLVWNNKQILFGEQVGMPENYIMKPDFKAETVCDKLLNAKPYVMNEAYKTTVYDNLADIIRTTCENRWEK